MISAILVRLLTRKEKGYLWFVLLSFGYNGWIYFPWSAYSFVQQSRETQSRCTDKFSSCQPVYMYINLYIVAKGDQGRLFQQYGRWIQQRQCEILFSWNKLFQPCHNWIHFKYLSWVWPVFHFRLENYLCATATATTLPPHHTTVAAVNAATCLPSVYPKSNSFYKIPVVQSILSPILRVAISWLD